MFGKVTNDIVINVIDRDTCATKPGRKMTRRGRVAVGDLVGLGPKGRWSAATRRRRRKQAFSSVSPEGGGSGAPSWRLGSVGARVLVFLQRLGGR
ncbi:hypothetical protein EO213_16575 [Paracoccus denitrificans]|nr:hypothetical protein EO213_16575 [Paracoccus denitrificans]